jgi:pimeloyl-ACP methyl ester carboxylesterase
MLGTGTLHYPTDAEPPFAGIAICPGFLNTGPEMAPWGPFYASWGIAVVVTNTTGVDLPNVRGDKLVAAIEELKTQNVGSGPLAGKLAGRYGTSGYSMGGGGTTFASAKDPTHRSSVGLAAWGPEGRNVTVPTLFLCSESDSVAGCDFSQTAYDAMGSTPKMLVKIPSASHFAWFDPNDAGRGMSGMYALAFQKVFLEGDERWRSLLLTTPAQGSVLTNIE